MQDAPLRQASESHDKKHEQETEKGPTLMITFFVKPLPFPSFPWDFATSSSDLPQPPKTHGYRRRIQSFLKTGHSHFVLSRETKKNEAFF